MSQEEVIMPKNVTLEVVSGEDKGKVYTLSNKTMTMGRSSVCDIQLNDPFISNKHCQVVFRGGHFSVIDLGSLNKTRVNGTVYVQKNLRNKDKIKIGKSELQFTWDDMNEDALNALEDILGQESDSAQKMD